jgi:hypothetical protein
MLAFVAGACVASILLMMGGHLPVALASGTGIDRECPQVDYESPALDRVRAEQQRHLESFGRFPDEIDVGSGAWEDVWEWHVRVLQQAPPVLTLGDGRRALQFRGTLVILRSDAPAGYFGFATDRP